MVIDELLSRVDEVGERESSQRELFADGMDGAVTSLRAVKSVGRA